MSHDRILQSLMGFVIMSYLLHFQTVRNKIQITTSLSQHDLVDRGIWVPSLRLKLFLDYVLDRAGLIRFRTKRLCRVIVKNYRLCVMRKNKSCSKFFSCVIFSVFGPTLTLEHLLQSMDPHKGTSLIIQMCPRSNACLWMTYLNGRFVMFVCTFKFRKDNMHAGKILLGHSPEIWSLMMSCENQVFVIEFCQRPPNFQIMDMVCPSLRQ